MTLYDKEGPVQVSISDQFLCKLPPAEKPALLEVVHPYFSKEKRGLICCRIRQGSLRDMKGIEHGPGGLADLPVDRVAAAVRRYRAKKTEGLVKHDNAQD